MAKRETGRAVEKIIVPILTYVEMRLVEEQVKRGVDLVVPMSRVPEGGGRVIWQGRPGPPKAVALDYLCEVLFPFKPKGSSGSGEKGMDERVKTTVKGFWQHLGNPNKKLPVLAPYCSIGDVREQYFKDLLARSRTLSDRTKSAPYAEVASLIEGAVDDRIRRYVKPDDDRPLIPERLAGKLRELAAARGEYAEASLRSCVKALVYLDARDLRTVEAALPVPDVPLLVMKETADNVGRALADSLDRKDGGGSRPVVLVVGKPGSGRATAMSRAISVGLAAGSFSHTFWYRFDSSLRRTVCSAVLGRNGNTDEEERFDQAVHALSTLSRSSSGRVIVALVDVGEEALASGGGDLARVARTGAVVMMTVSGAEEMEPPEGMGDAIVVRVGAASEDDLVKMGRANAEGASRGLWSPGTSDMEDLAGRCIAG